MTQQRATRFCWISYRKAPRDHGIENDARSIPRTSSRSSGRIRSTDSDPTTLQLGLGWPQVDGNEIGGLDRLPGREPPLPEHAYVCRRRSSARRGGAPPVRRVDLVGALAAHE